MNLWRPGPLMLAGTAAALLTLQPAASNPQPPAPDNPFTPVENWAKMPEGRTWGSTSAVDIDPDGRSIWVAERCGQNTCLGSDLDPVLKFDASGKLVRSFGRGLIVWPHGIHVDREGNVWVTDARDNRPSRPRGAPPDSPLPPAPAKIIGHQVFKFSPEGKVLMALGAPGGGTGSEGFMQPNDVITAPNGDIWVAEGHGGKSDRLVKFDRTGKFIAEFGRKGTGPGEFDQPHALAFDSKGRLFVADRSNNRIQIFDQSGKFLEQWTQFSRPSGLFIDSKDVLYAADSESGSIDPKRTDWKRGIYIGRISDGKVFALIPDPDVNAKGTSAAEGVAVDAAGNIYGAEVGPRRLMKYVRR
jgi:DNA-binding beta-propeller fold protein YncE